MPRSQWPCARYWIAVFTTWVAAWTLRRAPHEAVKPVARRSCNRSCNRCNRCDRGAQELRNGEQSIAWKLREREAELQRRFEARIEEEVRMRLAIEKANVAREVEAAESPLHEQLERQRQQMAQIAKESAQEIARVRAEAETEAIELRRQISLAKVEAANEAAHQVRSIQAAQSDLEHELMRELRAREASSGTDVLASRQMHAVASEQAAHKVTQVTLLAAQRELSQLQTAFNQVYSTLSLLDLDANRRHAEYEAPSLRELADGYGNALFPFMGSPGWRAPSPSAGGSPLVASAAQGGEAANAQRIALVLSAIEELRSLYLKQASGVESLRAAEFAMREEASRLRQQLHELQRAKDAEASAHAQLKVQYSSAVARLQEYDASGGYGESVMDAIARRRLKEDVATTHKALAEATESHVAELNEMRAQLESQKLNLVREVRRAERDARGSKQPPSSSVFDRLLETVRARPHTCGPRLPAVSRTEAREE